MLEKLVFGSVLAGLILACGNEGADSKPGPGTGPEYAPGVCVQHLERPCSLSLGTPTDQPLRFRMDSIGGSELLFTGERTYTRIRDTAGGAFFEVRVDGFIPDPGGSEPVREYHSKTTLFVDSISFYSASGLRGCTLADERRFAIPLLLNGCLEKTQILDTTPPDTIKAYRLAQSLKVSAQGDSIRYEQSVWGMRSASSLAAAFSKRGELLRLETSMGVLEPTVIRLTREPEVP
jgi:hypothetical protein